MSGNSSRYRFMRECKIEMSSDDYNHELFKRIYKMSGKWRSLNRMVINMERYMKYYMNYVYRCSEITDDDLKYLRRI